MSKTAELKELTRVRVLTFLREPEAIFWVFFFPMVLAAVLGFAFRSGGVEPVKVVVMSDDDTPPPIVSALSEDENIDVSVMTSDEDARRLLRRAAVDVIVEPADPPKLTLDPTRNEAAAARLRIMRAIDRAAGRVDPELEEEALTEKGSRYVDFLFPGLLGMNLMGTGMWGIGFAIADFRRRKFLKRLLVTPMRKSSFFLSFMLSRLVFLALEIGLLASFGVWVLGVPLRGDLLSFFLLCVFGAFLFAGLGLLTASRARTIEGVSGLMNFIMMPMWLASGVFFSYERFPEAFHPVAQALPLTALNDALRAIMIDGDSLMTQGPELAVMGVWCVVCFVTALLIFRWE